MKVLKRSLVIAMSVAMVFCMAVSVNAAAKPAKPTMNSVKHSGTKATVSWKKAKNAKKYELQEKIGSGSWKKIKTTTAVKFTKTIKYDKRYYFRVRGLNGKTKGSFSKSKSILVKKPAPKPTTPTSVTFHGETFKITSDGEKLNYTNKNGVKEWFGATSDGLYAHYYEKNGKVEFVIAPEDADKNKIPDIRQSGCDINVHEQGITWGFDNSNMSISFTFDGTAPTKGIGDVTGKTYFTKELSGKFTTGKIGRYNLETITKGSYAVNGQFDYGALLNPEGLDEKYYQPVSEENPGGSHIVLDNGKSYWCGYSTADAFRGDNVKASTPIKAWARVYEGNKRIAEKYVDIIPNLA